MASCVVAETELAVTEDSFNFLNIKQPYNLDRNIFMRLTKTKISRFAVG